jgi:hypothetical protein
VDGTEKKAQTKDKKALKDDNQGERENDPFREISEED